MHGEDSRKKVYPSIVTEESGTEWGPSGTTMAVLSRKDEYCDKIKDSVGVPSSRHKFPNAVQSFGPPWYAPIPEISKFSLGTICFQQISSGLSET